MCGVWDVESPLLHAEVSLLIGQGVFGHAGAFWVEERGLPSVKKNPVRRDSFFLLWIGVGQSSAEWPFFFILFCPIVTSSDCRAVLPNGHFLFWSVSNVQWVSAKVRPNGHLSYCPMLMPSQSFFCCFFVVLSGSLFVVYIVFYCLLTHPVSLNLQQK